MAFDIVGKLDDRIERKRKAYPCRTNRASEIGHPCLRYLVYCRTAWDKATLPDTGLQYIFEEGNLHERAVVTDLLDAGFHVSEQQRAYDDPEHNLSGHGDVNLLPPGAEPNEHRSIPAEIKSMSPFTWDTVERWEDLRDSRFVFLRRYPHQLNVYMWFQKASEAAFLLKNKATGRIKEVWMPYQPDMLAEDLEKCRVVNRHVEEGTTPDRIDDREWCERCRFNHLCLPDMVNEGTRFLDDDELLEKLERREVLAAAKKEYDALDKAVKTEIKGCEEAIIGDFSISGKWIDRKGYTVAESRYWRSSIVRMGGAREDAA